MSSRRTLFRGLVSGQYVYWKQGDPVPPGVSDVSVVSADNINHQGIYPTNDLPSTGVNLGDTAFDTTLGQLVVCVSTGPVVWSAVGGGGGSCCGVVTEDMTGTGWSTIAPGDVTATWTGSVLEFRQPVGSTTQADVIRNVSPINPQSLTWDLAVRLQVDPLAPGGSPRSQFGAGFRLNTNNRVLVSLISNGEVGSFSQIGGFITNHGFAAGPDLSQRTGGQLWLRLSRLDTGDEFTVWWGVGVAGALPDYWTKQYTTNISGANNALQLPSVFVYSGWFGEGGVGAAWNVDVLDIRTAWNGQI